MSGFGRRVRRAFRRLAVLPLLLFSARYHAYRSNREVAKRRLVAAIALAPDCFRAHLRLGALYLEEKDFYRAKREFLLARGLNPGRFRRLYPLVTGASGDVNINLFYFPGYTDREPAPNDQFLRDFIGEPRGESEPRETARIGDFGSFREFRKFQEMGPFRGDELERLDWDEVERQFQEDTGSLEN